MTLFYLILIWLGLGLLAGLLALAAHFKPAGWRRTSLLVAGVGASLVGGLLGFWLFGRLFSSLTALWIAILATCLPILCEYLNKWRAARSHGV